MYDSPDETLIEATLAGQDRAYEVLVQRYQDMVARFVFRIVPAAQDREEVCQDVFFKAYTRLGSFKFDAKFSTWLYSIAYRTAISHLRRRRHDVETLDEEPPGEASLERDRSAAEIAAVVNAELARLPVEERGMVTLYHLQGCGIEEISQIMDKPPGTIKSILFRVRKKLKDRIEPLVEAGADE